MHRRHLLVASTAALCTLAAPSIASALPARKRDAMRVGADPVAAPLARALLRGFGRDTGLVAQLDVVPSAALLASLESGETDVAFSMAPEAELKLEQQGLAHDRRRVATAELLIAGPASGGAGRGRDAVDALKRIAAGGLAFVGRRDGSGLHLAEQSLWRAAGVAPAAPWYLGDDKAEPLALAREKAAHVLIDRAAWSGARLPARGPFVALVEGDPQLEVPVHMLRSFRSPHPAGKLFAAWVGGGIGRRIVATQTALRPPPR